MKISIKNVIISAFFGALGPYFNKQATLDQTRYIYRVFNENEIGWLIYPFDILCIILMLWANTISVKYKMLSYKLDGAFIGTTMIFILGYLFSSGFDYLYEQQLLPLKRLIGAALVILGICLISIQESEDNVKKLTASVYMFVEDEDGEEVLKKCDEIKEECLIQKPKKGQSQKGDIEIKRENQKNVEQTGSKSLVGLSANDFQMIRKGAI